MNQQTHEQMNESMNGTVKNWKSAFLNQIKTIVIPCLALREVCGKISTGKIRVHVTWFHFHSRFIEVDYLFKVVDNIPGLFARRSLLHVKGLWILPDVDFNPFIKIFSIFWYYQWVTLQEWKKKVWFQKASIFTWVYLKYFFDTVCATINTYVYLPFKSTLMWISTA